jgi:CDP-diglyceride synthetase
MDMIIGAPVGGLAGALGGIAVSERGLAGAWPPRRSLAFAAVSLVAIAAIAWWIFVVTQNREQHAGRHVFVLLPVLGLSAVLGWLFSLRATGALR